jgi:hypothetical protein
VRVECLVEITAEFFYLGDKAILLDLEDFACWSKGACDFDFVKEIEPPTKETPEGGLAILEPQYDCEFIEPAIGFRYRWVSEGRCDYDYGCGIQFEEEHAGDDWFVERHEDWTREAEKLRAYYEAKETTQQTLNKLLVQLVKPENLPVRAVRWLEAAGYWSSVSYEGEHDGGVEVYGRVKLSDIQTLIQVSK